MKMTLRCMPFGVAALLAASAMAQATASFAIDGNGIRPSLAAVEQRKAEHEQIRHARETLKAQQIKDEAACYQRFAVDDCLRAVRAKVRDAEARLRTQEILLNDAERKEKAADRLKAIEEKQRSLPDQPAQEKNPRAVLRKSPSNQVQRDQDAALRADKQRSRAQQQADELERRTADNAERAAQARTRHAEKLKAAEERRARVEKAQADAAAHHGKSAAPLPAGSQAP